MPCAHGLTAEQAGDSSPDVVWLLREKKGEARPYSSGDRLPFGADVFPAIRRTTLCSGARASVR
jgi:hypothetical protein